MPELLEFEPVVSARAIAVQDVGDDPGSRRVVGGTSDPVAVHEQLEYAPQSKYQAHGISDSARFWYSVAASLIRIARQGLRVPTTSPSNDFAELAVEPGAESTNFAVGGLFKLLVARFAKDGPEAPDVAAFFPCLGVCPSVGGTLRLQSKCQANGIPDSARSGVVHIARRGLRVPITSSSDDF